MLRFRSLFGLVLISVSFLYVSSAAAKDQTVTGPAQIIDGDTLRVRGTTVRLHAIDAPELDQTCTDREGEAWNCGLWSRALLQHLATGDVTCRGNRNDRYGRLVAKCSVSGRDLGQEMVLQGAAFAYLRYGQDYAEAQKTADLLERGLWSGPVQDPQSWRVARASPQSASAPDTCRIKGNISSNGRIYHLEGQEHYHATRIDPTRGERWFCTEAQAQAAGWRKARR